MEESEALERLQKGEEQALEWLIDRYAPYVNTVVYNIIGGVVPPGDVEEASADVFLVLWRNAEKIQPGKVKAYLGAAARNKAREKLRGLGRTLPLEEDALVMDHPEHQLERKEQAELVRGAVRPWSRRTGKFFCGTTTIFSPWPRSDRSWT